MPAETLAHVLRGETVESVHTGHLAIVSGDGRTLFTAGDVSTVTYLRSAAKPIQAIPFVTSGAVDAFGFLNDEVALACASHSGEPIHIEIAARMLAKAGLKESDLRCGSHMPFNDSASRNLISAGIRPNQLHNNCSGKHAAMLALAKHIGADLATYDALDHRIQKRILRCVADFAKMPETDIAIGIDGCSAPNFAMPVIAMARSFANLAEPSSFPPSVQIACSRIVAAMTGFPHLIGGTERLDTMIMNVGGGRIISKVGAEGVWLCGILPSAKYLSGLGIALKIADGEDLRARPVIAVEVLRQLGIFGPSDLPELSPMPVKSRRGEIVGRIEPVVHI